MRRSHLATVVLIAGVPLAGCGSSPAPTATDAAGGITIPAEAGHVHGIATTRTGGVVIGTHGGLYALARGGQLERVGDSADYMGLAALPSGVPSLIFSTGRWACAAAAARIASGLSSDRV